MFGVGTVTDEASYDSTFHARLGFPQDTQRGRYLEVGTRGDRRGNRNDGTLVSQSLGDTLCYFWIDIGKLPKHAITYRLAHDLAELKSECRHDVCLFCIGLTVEKLPRLAEM